MPSRAELEATLLKPISQAFLLDSLAVLCWIVWFVFIIDVLRCGVDAARRGTSWQHLHPPGPLRRVAAALVGAVVLALLGNRTGSSASSPTDSDMATNPHQTMTTAPVTPGPTPPATVPVTQEVQPPHDGIHDSLWRITERVYGPGTGRRWPELYQLNRGVEQPDGSALVDPDLVRPGWKITAYVPIPAGAPPANGHQPPDPPPASTPPTASPSPSRPNTNQVPVETERPEPGLDLTTGAFVGVGLAALVTTALIRARRHRRRRYRPGTPEPADPGAPPIVRALRIAYDSMAQPVDEEPDTARMRNPEQTPIGVREGQTVALDVARSRGLGLTGPGAHAAARALIINLLADGDDDARVIIPADEFRTVFGQVIPARLPARLCVVDTLSAALDQLEAELLNRSRLASEAQVIAPARHAPLALVAAPTADTERRTQAILETGAALNLAGIILGRWRAAGTVLVREDGTVHADLHNPLSGTRLFTLPAQDATDLLALLHATEPVPEPATPAGEYEFLGATTDEAEDRPTDDAASPPNKTAPMVTSDTPPLRFQVLGRPHLTHTGPEPVDLSNAIAPRQREILIYLALHRDGCRRESLTAALWPDAPAERPYNSFHATLSQLRRVLRNATSAPIATLVVNEDGIYRLNPALVTVDLWQLEDALTAHHHTPTPATLRQISDLYRGDLADGITTHWLDPAREALRREVLDAFSRTVRAVTDDPEHMLTLLEQARQMDPYNEAIYRDLMRVQVRLGQFDSIPRTYNLLATALADLDLRPTQNTNDLNASLQKLHASRPG